MNVFEWTQQQPFGLTVFVWTGGVAAEVEAPAFTSTITLSGRRNASLALSGQSDSTIGLSGRKDSTIDLEGERA